MSLGPCRLEMKYSQRPSGDHTGPSLTERLSLTWIRRPSDTRHTTILLGEILPKVFPIVRDIALPLPQAINSPLGDQVQAPASRIRCSGREVPSSPRRNSESSIT